jgi:hypothetical protein
MSLPPNERKYEEVPSQEKLISVLEGYLEEYNLAATNPLTLGMCLSALKARLQLTQIRSSINHRELPA